MIARVNLNTTVDFHFSAKGLKKDVAQYLLATTFDRALTTVFEELYANPAISFATAETHFKEAFGVNLMLLTSSSQVKSYAFPGLQTFEVQTQWFPSLPPRSGKHGW